MHHHHASSSRIIIMHHHASSCIIMHHQHHHHHHASSSCIINGLRAIRVASPDILNNHRILQRKRHSVRQLQLAGPLLPCQHVPHVNRGRGRLQRESTNELQRFFSNKFKHATHLGQTPRPVIAIDVPVKPVTGESLL